jgi:hypothetical protein
MSHSEDGIFFKKHRRYLPASLTKHGNPNIFHLSLYQIVNWNKKLSFSLSYNIRRAVKRRGWVRPLSHAVSKVGFTFLALIWGGNTGLAPHNWSQGYTCNEHWNMICLKHYTITNSIILRDITQLSLSKSNPDVSEKITLPSSGSSNKPSNEPAGVLAILKLVSFSLIRPWRRRFLRGVTWLSTDFIPLYPRR